MLTQAPVTRDRSANRALILGVLCLPFGILAPFAILAGGRSLSRIRRSNGELAGQGRALLGLVCGVAGGAFLVLGIAYWWLAP
jgi:hypothetical protein